MKVKFVFALFPLILLATPIYAQIDQKLCSQCLKTAKEELKKCLDEAISQEDKTSSEKQDARTQSAKTGVKLKGRRKVVIKVKDFQKRNRTPRVHSEKMSSALGKPHSAQL